MGYIEHTLGRDEKLLYKAHFHWLRYADAWMAFFILVFLGGLINVFSGRQDYWFLTVGAGLGLVALFMKLLPLWTTEIGVTDHRLIIKRGWLVRTTSELQLRAIEEVNLDQGLLGRIFNFGRIVVHGTGVSDVDIPPIARPVVMLRVLQDATAHAQKEAKLST